jgi:hypothetical protein
MRAPPPVILCALLLSMSAACGGDDDGVDLVGDTPDEAADEIASATCDRRIECGNWNYELTLDENSDVTACTPFQEDEDRNGCISETRAEVRDDLECADPTDEELGQLGDCVNDVIAQDCITEEDLQAFCDALLAGEDPDEPGEPPASCDVLDTILEGCDGV